MIGLIGNFKERVKKKKGDILALEESEGNDIFKGIYFLKYKVLFNFKAFSVPFEANLLLQKYQQFSFLAPLKGLRIFFIF